jgi:hypothetical protein
MKDKIIESARGALLIILILGIPALLLAAYVVGMGVLQAASHAESLMGWYLVGLVLFLVTITCVRLCIVGIKRLLRSKQNLNMGGALVFISILSLIWLVGAKFTDRLTVTLMYPRGRRDFIEADLSWANLSGAYLIRINLLGADLRKANLSGADLRRANLRGADLSRADLSGANLSGANLREADLSGANLTRATVTVNQLATTKSLEGATMPDGTKHE